MVNLKIKKANGEIYWVENFNTKKECDKWLAEEKTRPYWKKDFTFEIEDKTEEINNAQIAGKALFEQKRLSLETAKDSLKKLKKDKLKTVADCIKAIEGIMDVLGIDDDA